MSLTAAEKDQIKSFIDRDEPIPARYRPALFPHGALDQAGWDRNSKFCAGFADLRGEEWATFHGPRDGPCPPPQVQAAWSWRREIWHLKFICRRSLGQAHWRYTSGEWVDWSPAQQELERLCHLMTALSAHNGMEDRIAQLANCFKTRPLTGKKQEKISFGPFFDNDQPHELPKTVAQVTVARGRPEWVQTHELANTIKHRWTGDFVSHCPRPEQVLRDLETLKAKYIHYGKLIPAAQSVVDPHYDERVRGPIVVDQICETAQKSLNLLIGVAEVLDKEIGWRQYFSLD
jgi:hypothetical protein